MFYTKDMMIYDIRICKRLVGHIEKELIAANTDDVGRICDWDGNGNEYSLAKAKRHCNSVRKILNNIKKGCDGNVH